MTRIVTVYTTPGSTPGAATCQALTDARLPFILLHTDDPPGFLHSHTDRPTPLVTITEKTSEHGWTGVHLLDYWTGFQPNKIRALHP